METTMKLLQWRMGKNMETRDIATIMGIVLLSSF